MGKKPLKRTLKRATGKQQNGTLDNALVFKDPVHVQSLPSSIRLFDDCPQWVLELGRTYSGVHKKDVLSTCLQHVLQADVDRDCDYAEVFAGQANFSREMKSRSFKGNSYDLMWSSSQDFTTCTGFLNISLGCKRVREKGLVVLAPQCSTWPNFLCAARTQRSLQNISGDENIPEVYDANITANHVAWLVNFLTSRGVYILLEQPGDSLMMHYPSIEFAFRVSNVERHFTWLGAFGNALAKPTNLFTTVPFDVAHRFLVRSKPRDAKAISAVTVGKHINGTSLLDASAAYTPEFACALVDCFEECQRWNNFRNGV